jgi:CubicO group peptidase (beta-lactamase class C family)
MPPLSSAWPLERSDPQAVGLCPHRLGRVGDLVRRFVEEGRVPGVVTLVARRGRIAHLETVGCMDLAARRPMRDDAIMRIYSMSKIITSTAALMLMEEGRFQLVDPVCKYLPEFKEVRVSVKGADGKDELVRPRRDVTIHDLLTHTAGLTYELIHEARKEGLTLKAFVEEFCKRPLRRHPGEVWDYSAATDVLGRLVEVVGGLPFDEFLQRRIFGPLGMADTAFWVPPEKVDRLANLYRYGKSGKLAIAGEDEPAYLPILAPPKLSSGGGGLLSTTSDYLRFALMLLNKGAACGPGRAAGGESGQTAGARLLGRKTVELMTSDNLPAGHPPLGVNNLGFGLGVEVLRRLGEARKLGSVGEFGWGGAACTQVWIDPAEDMVSMIMLQLLPGGPFPIMNLFKQTVYQAIVD